MEYDFIVYTAVSPDRGSLSRHGIPKNLVRTERRMRGNVPEVVYTAAVDYLPVSTSSTDTIDHENELMRKYSPLEIRGTYHRRGKE